MDIKEGNKLIAEFMGAHCSSSHGEVYCFDGDFIPQNPGYDGTRVFYNLIEPIGVFDNSPRYPFIKFNSCWNWLMPVIDRIHDLLENYHIEMHKRFIRVLYNWEKFYTFEPQIDSFAEFDDSFKDYKYDLYDSKIEACWTAIIEFIKWYNDN